MTDFDGLAAGAQVADPQPAAALKIEMRFAVRYLNGDESRVAVRLPLSLGDQAAFERHFDRSSVAIAQGLGEMYRAMLEQGTVDTRSGLQVQWLAFLVWRQLRRAGLPPNRAASFEAFLDDVDDLDMIDAQPIGGPPGPPAAPTPQPAAAGASDQRTG